MATKHQHSDTDTPVSFEDMLKTAVDEVKEPERIPSGQWIMRCTGAKSVANDDFDPGDDNSARGTILFTHTPVRPGDNVDTAAVEGGEWRGRRVFTRFNIRDKSDLFQVKSIIAGHGIDTEGRGFDEALVAMRGRTVEATVGLRTYKRRTGETVVENTLSNFAAA